jgi:hypothetical protein
MKWIKVSKITPCKTHKKSKSYIGYVQTFLIAEERIRRGENQKQCKKCKRWYFEDEL